MTSLMVPTERFGELIVDVDDIIVLPDGLVGFVSIERVILVPIDDDGSIFWMQAVDQPGFAIVVASPWHWFPDYEPVMSQSDQEAIALERAADAAVFVVLTSHVDPRRFTANLLGPVVVNTKRKLGRQIVGGDNLSTQTELHITSD